MNEEKDYDVVVHALKIHRERLWLMTKSNDEWGVMDQIRMEQIEKLDKAIAELESKND